MSIMGLIACSHERRSQFGLNPSDAGKASGAKQARDIIRKETIGAVPELEKLGLDYGMAKEVTKIMEDAASRMSNRQRLNIFKLGSAGIGYWLHGIPGLVGGFVAEQMVNSPKFTEIASKIVRGAGKAKPKTPKSVKLFGKTGKSTYLFGKAGRFSNPYQKTGGQSVLEEE